MGDAFIPGDFEDIVRKTGNKKIDLQDYLSKILRKERFYRVKTDYLAKDVQVKSSMLSFRPNTRKPKDVAEIVSGSKVTGSFASFTAQNGGILINITINKVYVFHKSLKEIEEFFSKMLQCMDNNSVLLHLVREILSR